MNIRAVGSAAFFVPFFTPSRYVFLNPKVKCPKMLLLEEVTVFFAPSISSV